MQFTDSEGRIWEVVPRITKLSDDTYLIRPVKEPKWEVTLMGGDSTGDCRITVYLKLVTKDQAQLIKEAVEALMGQIFSDTDRLVLIEAITSARHSLKEENNA